MILIADSGSTKCDWILLDDSSNNIITRERTKGINPSVLKKKDIVEIFNSCSKLFKYRQYIHTIYFFGAGCNNSASEEKIELILRNNFENVSTVIVKEDLMLAVFAASQDPSVVCILGTGSNCCFFNGEKIEQRVKAMGYMLMDEGSGNHLGKEVLKSYYYKKMPDDLRFSLEKSFKMSDEKVLKKLYSSKMPNKYLAKFARFLFENIEHPYAKEIITLCVSEFIDKQLLQYKEELTKVPLYFIGSVGYHAQEIIEKELLKRGIKQPENFIRRPLNAFIESISNQKVVLQKVV